MKRIFAHTGIVLLAIFFDLVTCALVSVAIALLWPGTPFDVIWLAWPDHRFVFWPYRLWLGLLFLLLTVPATLASYGLFQRKVWARELAVAVFAANALGDALQIARGHTLNGIAAVCIAGLLLLFLASPAVRMAFND